MVVVVAATEQMSLGIRNLNEIPSIQEIVRAALGLPEGSDWLSNIAAFVILPPVPQVAAGDQISSPNIGTVGCQVKWTGGNGFLTAGHVAPTAGQNVSGGGTVFGTVRFSKDPSGGGTARCVDVAVVELASGITFSPSLSGPTSAGPSTSVSVNTVSGGSGTIIALASFFYMASMGGTYGDAYLTSAAFTTGGDSGAAAVDSSNNVIGMVVGASPGVTTIIQDIGYQFAEIGKLSTAFPSIGL